MKQYCESKNNQKNEAAEETQSGIIPAEAKSLHAKGRTYGITGELDKAIESFLQATLYAPDWPQLYFDLGVAYVYKRENRKALFCFKKVNELEPEGFLSSKTAWHTLQKEEKGEFAPGTLLSYLSIETEEDPIRKKQITLKLLEHTPDFAPAWAELVNLSPSKREQLYYINRGIKCQSDAETKGYLFIQKALVIYNTGKRQEAIEILKNICNAPVSTLRNRKQARMLLENWLAAHN